MDLFFKDSQNAQEVSWFQLIDDVVNTRSFNPYCKSESIYSSLKNIIISMLIGQEIVLLDSDFSDSELVNLTGCFNYEKFAQVIDKEKLPLFRSKEDLISNLKKTGANWKITLFTSGTTGIPKKVTHDFQSISRFVKISDQNKSSVWGFAYNPTHMAGIQVFLQALLNGNSIVNLFGLKPNEIFGEIEENKITHLSATPTFYRLLLPCENSFHSVLRITSGGERFNEKAIKQFKDIFPNAKITNVYATTETGTLFASKDEIFSVKAEFEHLIRVEDGELVIHNSLMGITEINIKDWYNTGDLIEVLSENPLKFKFISRKTDMINVGGYKVNPIEVEEVILTISGIKNVRVYSKSNSVLGNVICCDVVCDSDQESESSIRKFLQSKIQEFKIPRIIRFVDELSTTRTGKIKRT